MLPPLHHSPSAARERMAVAAVAAASGDSSAAILGALHRTMVINAIDGEEVGAGGRPGGRQSLVRRALSLGGSGPAPIREHDSPGADDLLYTIQESPREMSSAGAVAVIETTKNVKGQKQQAAQLHSALAQLQQEDDMNQFQAPYAPLSPARKAKAEIEAQMAAVTPERLQKSELLLGMYVNRSNAMWAERQAWAPPNVWSLKDQQQALGEAVGKFGGSGWMEF